MYVIKLTNLMFCTHTNIPRTALCEADIARTGVLVFVAAVVKDNSGREMLSLLHRCYNDTLCLSMLLNTSRPWPDPVNDLFRKPYSGSIERTSLPRKPAWIASALVLLFFPHGQCRETFDT